MFWEIIDSTPTWGLGAPDARRQNSDITLCGARLPWPEFHRIWRPERARTCYHSLSFAHNSPKSVRGKPVARPGMDAQSPDLIPGRASWQAVAPWISEAPLIQSEVPELPSRY